MLLKESAYSKDNLQETKPTFMFLTTKQTKLFTEQKLSYNIRTKTFSIKKNMSCRICFAKSTALCISTQTIME